MSVEGGHLRLLWVQHAGELGLRAAGAGDERPAGLELFDVVGVDDEFAAAAAGAGLAFGVREALVGALGVKPRAAGAGDSGDRFGGVRDDLAVGDQGGEVAEDLVGEARGGRGGGGRRAPGCRAAG